MAAVPGAGDVSTRPGAGDVGAVVGVLAIAMRARSMAGSVMRRVGVEAPEGNMLLGLNATDDVSGENVGGVVEMAGRGGQMRTAGMAPPAAAGATRGGGVLPGDAGAAA